eukprot:TRINITY_DN3039_c0_g1_i1.p1 TRINITY_DN3039_c0_g1~~TRINITY_DN3039_c0_g1_i1.p1  ORF type:complete len:77 (-),score=17.14 TRINITY_DN3039_c0_g1_i1:15-245(-)
MAQEEKLLLTDFDYVVNGKIVLKEHWEFFQTFDLLPMVIIVSAQETKVSNDNICRKFLYQATHDYTSIECDDYLSF